MIKILKHKIEYFFLLLLFYLFRFLNIRISSFLGGIIIYTYGFFSKKNKIAFENISYALPNLNYKQKKLIIKKMWFNLGRVLGEYPNLDKIKILGNHNIKVIDHINCIEPCNKFNNCLFFSAHIGNWEVTAHPITQFGNDMWFIYRAPNNIDVDNLLRKIRSRYGVGLIRKGPEGAKKCISLLNKKKKNLGMLIDQKMNDGIKTTFFGRNVMTASAIAKFAIKYKCPIIPTLCIRESGIKLKIIYFKPIYFKQLKKIGSEKDIMNYLNKYVESWISKYPDQWLWIHRRW